MVKNIGNHKESEMITIRKHQVNNKKPSPTPTGGAGGMSIQCETTGRRSTHPLPQGGRGEDRGDDPYASYPSGGWV